MIPYVDGKEILYVGNSGPEDRNRLLGNAFALLNRGAMPEFILNGKTGFIVNNVEEAVEAVNSIEFIDRRDCMEWATLEFSRERMFDAYLEVYQKIPR